jgi:hypothetical protein
MVSIYKSRIWKKIGYRIPPNKGRTGVDLNIEIGCELFEKQSSHCYIMNESENGK